MGDIIPNDREQDIFNRMFSYSFIKAMNIPKENLKRLNEYIDEIENIGFDVHWYDITMETFKPFYKNMIPNVQDYGNIFMKAKIS